MALLKICIFFVLIAASASAPKRYRPNANSAYFRVQRILSSVPDEERQDFVRYQMFKGYELLEKKQNPEFNYELSDADSILLYEYYLTNNLIEDEQQVESFNTVICWNGKCVDISDPGVHP